MRIDTYLADKIWSGPIPRTALDILRSILGGTDTHFTHQMHATAGSATAVAEQVQTQENPREFDDTLKTLAEGTEDETLPQRIAELEAILHSMPEGVIITDAEGEIIQASPVAQTWLNQTLSPEDADRVRETTRNLVQQTNGDNPGSQESEGSKQTETTLELTGLDIELKVAPISGGTAHARNGNALVMAHDVSYLKAMDRAKSRFVSNASHELRTPVTTIKLYAALLQQTQPGNGQWEKYLNALVHEADRQAQLLEDILRICRIDARRLEINSCPTPLNELTTSVVASHRVLAQEQGVTLEHYPMEPTMIVPVDLAQMTQVLNNLVENALYYTPEGGKIVVSTVEKIVEGYTWATLTVADTGIGIPASELPHIFDRFFRGEEPQVMQITGTGLGLAIVKEIVELHGGRVTVQSLAAPKTNGTGTGSAFTVWLPLAN